MVTKELEAELAVVQQELEGMFCSRRPAHVDPQTYRRYALLLAEEELLLLKRRRMSRQGLD